MGKYYGKGYLSENINNLPKQSVGFWISDVDLRFNNGYYIYERNGITKQIVYKGSEDALPIIPKGKLIRLSLAKWWAPNDSDIEERCYLQLSGWYEDKLEPIKKIEKEPQIKFIPKSTTFDLPKIDVSPTSKHTKNKSGACYIATLCYEDAYSDEVCTFRDFRDITLNKTKLGIILIKNYYLFAPHLVSKLENHKTLNKIIRIVILNPILKLIKLLKLDKK